MNSFYIEFEENNSRFHWYIFCKDSSINNEDMDIPLKFTLKKCDCTQSPPTVTSSRSKPGRAQKVKNHILKMLKKSPWAPLLYSLGQQGQRQG